ncbi:WhiB family transcriptional regulator [Nocardiopsis sp. MT53]|uniref:WhiB family transcriptional regulator n=2 Tax=Nocardiopsis changdeensis TaxID=2831969 RepID=A0ABX8BPG8_9ACTN|nr:WhiB family transcriptional regulator [Nocardiopsis changdeensis]QYX34532.1 WhiB family transcriptional regulator [Nocardiopsis sp. MT53]
MTDRTPCQSLADPDLLFGGALQQRRLRHICVPCSVHIACLTRVLSEGVKAGLWGGMTHSERKSLLRRHPDVTDWHAFLTHNTSVPPERNFARAPHTLHHLPEHRARKSADHL